MDEKVETSRIRRRESPSMTPLTRELVKFSVGWLLLCGLSGILPGYSYNWPTVTLFTLMYLVFTGPLYLQSCLRLILPRRKAFAAVLLFYFLLFTCWGFWENSVLYPSTGSLLSPVSTGVVGALIAGGVISLKKVYLTFVVLPGGFVIKLLTRLTRLTGLTGKK